MLKLEKEQYTKEEVEQLFKPFGEEIASLKQVVVEGQKAVDKVKILEKDNLTNAIKLEIAKNGLDPETVYDLVEADSIDKAQAKIVKVLDMKKQQSIDNSFKPEEKRKQTDEYIQHEKSGNVEGMLKSKLSKLFQ